MTQLLRVDTTSRQLARASDLSRPLIELDGFTDGEVMLIIRFRHVYSLQSRCQVSIEILMTSRQLDLKIISAVRSESTLGS